MGARHRQIGEIAVDLTESKKGDIIVVIKVDFTWVALIMGTHFL